MRVRARCGRVAAACAGDIPAAYMPWVLRIAAACSHTSGGDSQAAMSDISRGISTWRASLNRGLLPDDEAIQQLLRNNEPFTRGAPAPALAAADGGDAAAAFAVLLAAHLSFSTWLREARPCSVPHSMCRRQPVDAALSYHHRHNCYQHARAGAVSALQPLPCPLVLAVLPLGHTLEELRWPAEPLRTTLLRGLGKLGLARYAQKYEAVQVSRGLDS